MGTSVIRKLLAEWPRSFIGIEFAGADLNRSIVSVNDGRIYAVLSNIMGIVGKDKVANVLSVIDPLASSAIEEVDLKTYTDHQLWLKLAPIKAGPKILSIMPQILYARTFPEKALRETQMEIERFKVQVRKDASSKGTIAQVAQRVFSRGINCLRDHVVPVLAAGRWSLERLKKCAEGADPEQIKNLELAMPNNITIEMGLALYDMAQQLPPDAGSSDIQDQTLSPEFMERWHSFIDKFGHRGPRELDIASKRNRDEATLLFDQVQTLVRSSSQESNPIARYENNRRLREQAYIEICKYLKEVDAKRHHRFQFLYRCWEVFGGFREMPKYCLVYAIDALRSRLIEEGERLVSKKRLENIDQLFDLKLEDFDKKVGNKKIDLVELGQENRRHADKLAAVSQLPALIDSRGRILRATRRPTSEDGAVVGTPISNGIARGPIKVLHFADEKPLESGDILVARATDPGWTPLFVNAAAVVLEVGGLLQHGALVAREYGLPCVGGVTGATNLWADGTIVEVDGNRGTIRLVEEAKNKETEASTSSK
jgi:pyruvate,water dikinase